MSKVLERYFISWTGFKPHTLVIHSERTFQKQKNIYHQEYSSVTKTQRQTNVSVAVDVVSVDDLDVVEMIFRVKVLVKLKWFDSR